MAKRKTKKKHKAKSHKAKSHKAKPKGRAPKSAGVSLDSVPKIMFSSAILRFGSGFAYWGIRKFGYDSPKIKIAVPAAAAFAYAKGLLPKMEGFYPLAIGQATDATIENVKFLKDIFDLKFLDKKPTALPTAGMTPRSAAETARLIAANARRGLVWQKQGLVFTRKAGMVYGAMTIAEKNNMSSPSIFANLRRPKSGLTRDMRRAA